MRILITGSAGSVAQAVLPFLRQRHEIVGFDRHPTPGCDTCHVGDLTDVEALRRAMEGCEVVIHLAANAWNAPFEQEMVPNNIIGPYNVLEAARGRGVRRVVLASTCHTVMDYPRDHVVEVDEPYHPDNLYGVTKAYAEVLGRLYHSRHGLEFVAVRIGWLLLADSKYIEHPVADGIWISERDLADLLLRAVETADVGFLIVFATSHPAVPQVSLRSAREALGYEPQDSLEERRAERRSTRSA